MAQQFAGNFKTRTALIVFIKNAVAPIVLYVENPYEEYNSLLEIFKSQSAIPKLIEKNTLGPVKKVAFMSNQIAGLAIQEEQIMN